MDFTVTLSRRYESWWDFDVRAKIIFPNPLDGLQATELPKEYSNSAFKWPRLAPEAGYQPEFEAHTAWFPNNQNRPPIQTYNENQNYFLRVRTVKKDGLIISALYGKIRGGLGLDPRGSKLCGFGFTYYLNPTPLDRNIEWDPKQNIFTNLEFLEKPRDP
jgi:hypothetical protein